jgi:CRISPR/Cas system CMR-associated protein Cmr1 (group 7 of RAMP superfamily)
MNNAASDMGLGSKEELVANLYQKIKENVRVELKSLEEILRSKGSSPEFYDKAILSLLEFDYRKRGIQNNLKLDDIMRHLLAMTKEIASIRMEDSTYNEDLAYTIETYVQDIAKAKDDVERCKQMLQTMVYFMYDEFLRLTVLCFYYKACDDVLKYIHSVLVGMLVKLVYYLYDVKL